MFDVFRSDDSAVEDAPGEVHCALHDATAKESKDNRDQPIDDLRV
ncbi:hypothetical protein AKJ08_1837 [Vulgatibacter incomptus]|uniref:Uncharacterized protein n=1 Tax=Vulgatibacter incomptus TaxID=1391653 RepID=A0A0K1PD53_9BACT|nr:hypothetical protein AKJ08_1837 [Vulgatibacter incomptus]